MVELAATIFVVAFFLVLGYGAILFGLIAFCSIGSLFMPSPPKKNPLPVKQKSIEDLLALPPSFESPLFNECIINFHAWLASTDGPKPTPIALSATDFRAWLKFNNDQKL